MGFYGGNVFQLVPVTVVRQWFPKFVHVVSIKYMVTLRISKLVRPVKVISPYFVKFVGVKQFS